MKTRDIVHTEHSHKVQYRIEIWRKGGCCEQHKHPGWYEAKGYRGILADPNTSQEYAEVLLSRMQEEHWKSQYRLVEVEETHRVVERVVAS